jgi:hypothetical protein
VTLQSFRLCGCCRFPCGFEPRCGWWLLTQAWHSEATVARKVTLGSVSFRSPKTRKASVRESSGVEPSSTFERSEAQTKKDHKESHTRALKLQFAENFTVPITTPPQNPPRILTSPHSLARVVDD